MTQIIRTTLSDCALSGLDEIADDCCISRGEALDFLVTKALIQIEKEIREDVDRMKAIARKDKFLNYRR